MRITATFVVCSFIASMASANTQAANACKETLSPVGQQIYTAVVAQNPTPSTGRSLVTKEVKKLMAEGKVDFSEGRKAGEAAGACLKKLE